jgi:hypothetical protein
MLGAVAATALLAACGKGDHPRLVPLSEFGARTTPRPDSASTGAPIAPDVLPADARVAIDSGNALYRGKRYADALAQYRRAATSAPHDATPYFGIYMVANVTKNRPLLDSAATALRARGMMEPAGTHK